MAEGSLQTEKGLGFRSPPQKNPGPTGNCFVSVCFLHPCAPISREICFQRQQRTLCSSVKLAQGVLSTKTILVYFSFFFCLLLSSRVLAKREACSRSTLLSSKNTHYHFNLSVDPILSVQNDSKTWQAGQDFAHLFVHSGL